MSKKSVIALIMAGGITSASAAHADHMSIWGPSSANMPNDIHNTVIEDGTDALQVLVINGGGADSVNRYDTAE